MERKRGRSPRRPDLELLGPLLKKNPKLLDVLSEYGVHFCPGCYLTLFSPLKKAAAYHAVPDIEAFLRDARAVLGRRLARGGPKA